MMGAAVMLSERLCPDELAHAGWIRRQAPLFECPDAMLQQTYYFRWSVFRKHIHETPDGYVITEFLPEVGWSGKYNTIACAAGHHFYEARWLRDRKIPADYARFWFRKGGSPNAFGFWAADAIYNWSLVTGDFGVALELLPDLVENVRRWEGGWRADNKWSCSEPRLDPNGLFWQVDTHDGMEFQIGGHGYRPTLNSYLYGDMKAIAALAERAGEAALAGRFAERAEGLRTLVHDHLWDPEAQFFKTLVNEAGARPHYDWQSVAPRIWKAGERVDVRELIGYVPWYFNLPRPGYEVAWRQLTDPEGFKAPFGPTTAEQRHPHFLFEHTHDCLWNGYSWPFATTQTLVALANLLNHYEQDVMTRADYFETLSTYARCHRLVLDDGREIPWIDENLDPFTGVWEARRKLQERGDRNAERGKDYNHSGFCDLVISGLVGVRPQPDDTLVVHPLVPDGEWAWFCLDGVPYHGRLLTVQWDADGRRYGRGAGLAVYVDGREAARSALLSRLHVDLANS